MGAKIAILLVFAVLCSSLALALTETQITFLNAQCDAQGNIVVDFKQTDRPIEASTINFTAVHGMTGEVADLEGDWLVNNQKVKFLIGKPDDAIDATFASTNGKLTKNGNYTVLMTFLHSASQFSQAKIKFEVSCPGLACFSDMMCGEAEFCDKGNCNYLKCDECHVAQFHTCASKCDDGNPCTKDICNSGVCVNKYVGGNCCVTNEQCNDGLVCTSDYCEKNKCYNDPVVCKKADDKCVFAVCGEPKGCTYQTDKSCLEKENERRRYLITIGEPEVVKEPFLSRITNWISGILGNFF